MMITVKTVHGTRFAINPNDISTIRDDGDNVHVSFTANSSIDVDMKFDEFMRLINEHDNVNAYGKMTEAVCGKLDEINSVICGGFAHIVR